MTKWIKNVFIKNEYLLTKCFFSIVNQKRMETLDRYFDSLSNNKKQLFDNFVNRTFKQN